MIKSHPPSKVLPHLSAWARGQEAIRAVLLTGSWARHDGPVDVFSDYDVILVVEDIHPFYEDRSWLDEFGRVLVAYWDPIQPLPGTDVETVGSVLLFEDGLHIDFTLWPAALMRQVAAGPELPPELDDGYRILVDKDGLTAAMKSSTELACVPRRPSEEEYQKCVEDFFSDAPYVAKCLWRDELLPAKWCLDYDMKHVFLRPMLEWRMECDYQWSAPAGVLGRGLKGRLPPELWLELEQTYVGAGLEENWEALLRTMALFRRAATEVAERLGYVYPLAMDEGVSAYVREVRLTPPYTRPR
jgi:aminoglycoside 6-adenylyltransferase